MKRSIHVSNCSHIVLLAIVMLSISLTASLPGYCQFSASQDSPVIEIPQSRWYYRWGDSPVDDRGMPFWIYEDTASPEWKPVRDYSDLRRNPQKHHVLWLLIQLPEGHLKYPAVLLPPVSQSLEVYQNHQRIYRFGQFSPSSSNRYSMATWHHIPLENAFGSDKLFLRIYSDNPQYIGIQTNKVWLGTQMGLIRAIIKFSIEYLILGFFFIFACLFSVFAYFRRREQKPYFALSFGLFVVCLGIGQLAGCPISQLFIDPIALRYYLSSTVFLLWPIGLYVFIEQILGRGYKSLIRRIWQVHILFAIGAFLLDITNVFPMSFTVPLFLGLLMVDILVTIPIAVKAAFKGNFEAKVLNAGMGILMLSGTHDILASFGVIPPWYFLFPWGVFIFIVFLGYILEYRLDSLILAQQRDQQVFEPIPNPYIVGNPIRSKDMFFGREDDFRFVQAKLGTGEAGLVIVLAGERRSGKTSILFQVLNGELGERFVPVLADMQAMAVDSDAEFLERVASEINAVLGEQLELIPATFREGNPIRTFERFIAQAMEALDGKALLLLLDEYELIEAKMDDGTLRPDLITFFASLMEAFPRLSFIFTGSRHLEQRNVAYWRVLIGKSLYRRISFLSQPDALRLITDPVKDRVVYPRGIPERIVRLTSGQPFYTQVVCQNMMDRLNEVQRNRVRQEDVDAVAQELADNPLPQMIYFWDGLETEQQNALSFLGEVLEDSNRYASAQMLANFAQEQNLEFVGALNLTPLPELERVLNELFVREVLQRERAGEGQYEYRFRVDLFRLWVRQAHSVWEQ